MDDFETFKAARLKHLDWLQLSQARSVTPPPRGTSLSQILASDPKGHGELHAWYSGCQIILKGRSVVSGGDRSLLCHGQIEAFSEII